MNIDAIDKYWRAANFLTVSNMYLKDNKFLTRDLEDNDIMEYAVGHWGTCPGINFIYGHINRYIKKYGRRTQLIIGPGHGGNALLANLQLEQLLEEQNITLDLSLSENVRVKQNVLNIRSEVNPYIPGVIYDGGELGYSLAVAFGSVLDAPHDLCVCVIGDGEAETGTISASWACKEYFDNSSGFVLPILHMNGYKMGSKSLFSQKSDKEIKAIFSGFGYRPLIVGTDHEEMINAMDWVEVKYKEIENGEHNEWPILILRSPKGWTAPTHNGFHIEDRLIAHKNPLRNLHSKETKDYLDYWLKSYRPKQLFDSNGMPNKDVLSIIPDKNERLGNTLSRYERRKIKLPDIDEFYLHNVKSKGKYPNVLILEKYLSSVIKLNPTSFRVMSPDELESNLLGELKKVSINEGLETVSDNGRVLEILNENICQAWMQGYVLTGRNCLMVSYEAFMPIITSMVSQFAKWIFQAEQVKWRKKVSSITYLITSLCWSNTYSHQNPEFINSLISNQHDFIRIYTPPDANCLLECMKDCLSSEGKINLIVSTKQKMPQWIDDKIAHKSIKEGIIHWTWIEENEFDNPDIVIAAAGDYPVRECMEAISSIKMYLSHINIRFLSVVELTSIGTESIYPHAMSSEKFKSLFTDHSPVIFCFHGYPSAIKMLLHDRLEHKRLSILGYNNKSILSTNDIRKLILNKCSRYHIMLEICRILYHRNHISEKQYTKITNDINYQIEREYFD
ncbi:phosphoketolase family protein [Clostridium beijerinckii]|uniref:phosphoketolase family protein n=1 Tax=Clostridium beijerinckii TaxID=1520 RepID=UPI0022DF7FCE|nr:phosphoketolase family protein [Clostridium beijerinckii]